MPSDYKVLVLPLDAQTGGELSRSGLQVRPHRGWLEVLGVEWRSDAQELSRRFLTSAVWWSMQTPIDQVWLCCFQHGLDQRELRFSAEKAGWSANRGEPLPFEDRAGVELWLKSWLRQKKPLAPREGLELLNAFLGRSPARLKVKPKKKKAPRRK